MTFEYGDDGILKVHIHDLHAGQKKRFDIQQAGEDQLDASKLIKMKRINEDLVNRTRDFEQTPEYQDALEVLKKTEQDVLPKLENPDADARRSAATDLGTLGRPVAIVWLEQAAAKEPNKWVRYTMLESAALLKLAADDQAAKLAAVNALGELASQNALPALQDIVNAGSGDAASESQQALAKAARASIERYPGIIQTPQPVADAIGVTEPGLTWFALLLAALSLLYAIAYFAALRVRDVRAGWLAVVVSMVFIGFVLVAAAPVF